MAGAWNLSISFRLRSLRGLIASTHRTREACLCNECIDLPAECAVSARMKVGTARMNRDPEMSAGPSRAVDHTVEPAHADSAVTEFRELLRARLRRRGMQWSWQRQLISEVFFSSPPHTSVEELQTLVHAKDRRVGIGAVYRTLRLLVDLQLARVTDLNHRTKRYEWTYGNELNHDHLVCVGCGKIVDFDEPLIVLLRRRVAADRGFVMRSHRHVLYGECSGCQAGDSHHST